MPDTDPIDAAWRIHSAVSEWTGRVDAKASFVLTIQSAILAATVALTAGGRRLSNLHRFWPVASFVVGIAALCIAILLVVWVVRPRLRHNEAGEEANRNFIYFGHSRHWDAAKLQAALRDQDLLPVLCRQIVETSKICWDKHRLVQVSVTVGVAGTAAVGLAALLNG